MAAKTSARVTIKANGKVRALMSISSAPKKRLVISMRPAAQYVEHGKALTASSPTIISQKYTIHLSNNSSKNANCIHHTQIIEGNDPINTYNYTQAIKVYNKFAPIFCRRFGDIFGKNFNAPDDKVKCIDLGNIDPSRFNLTLMVFVGPPNREFIAADWGSINTYQWFGHEFSLLFLWSFINVPDAPIGTIIHFESVPFELWEETSLEDVMRPHVAGFDDLECLYMFKLKRDDILNELKNIIANNTPPEVVNHPYFTKITHFKTPSTTSDEYVNYIKTHFSPP